MGHAEHQVWMPRVLWLLHDNVFDHSNHGDVVPFFILS